MEMWWLKKMRDEEEKEHIETRATAPFLLDVAHTKPRFPVPYKNRHTLIVCVRWHISIGTLVTHYTTLRSFVPLKSKQIL